MALSLSRRCSLQLLRLTHTLGILLLNTVLSQNRATSAGYAVLPLFACAFTEILHFASACENFSPIYCAYTLQAEYIIQWVFGGCVVTFGNFANEVEPLFCGTTTVASQTCAKRAYAVAAPVSAYRHMLLLLLLLPLLLFLFLRLNIRGTLS